MIVSIESRFIFLSVPKCGSSAIVRAIRDDGQITAFGYPELKHTPYTSLESFILPYIHDRVSLTRRDFTVLCLVREPIAWLHSWFSYRSRRALKNPAHRNYGNYTGDMTFNEFALAWLSRPCPPFADVGTQSRFILSSDGQIGPDAVFRHEEIDAAVQRISAIIGRRIRLRRTNVSHRRGNSLDDEIRIRLTTELERDYEIYDRIE